MLGGSRPKYRGTLEELNAYMRAEELRHEIPVPVRIVPFDQYCNPDYEAELRKRNWRQEMIDEAVRRVVKAGEITIRRSVPCHTVQVDSKAYQWNQIGTPFFADGAADLVRAEFSRIALGAA